MIATGQTLHGEFMCEACMMDKNTNHYLCSAGCDYRVCADCAECRNGHLLEIAQGVPQTYAISNSNGVFCNLCNKMGLDKESFFWHCDQCSFDACTGCAPAVDHEDEKYGKRDPLQAQ